MRGDCVRAVPLPFWQELLVGIELVYLRVSPVYWGSGVPKGDNSAVVVVPAFLGTDLYLTEFRAWLRRIGYRPYKSGIGLNADCPNLLGLRLRETIERAYKSTRRKVHLVGHSLGGLIAWSAAAQMPHRVASVISLGGPLRGIACHSSIASAAELVRARILQRHGEHVLPNCYTTECTCSFLQSLVTKVPQSVARTAVYTRLDGLVDWHLCRTGDPAVDCEVSATHIGMAFNPLVYQLIANRLAAAAREVRSARRTRFAA